jgi:hypothetical protein
MAYIPPPKFSINGPDGILNVIALVDSRHDFKGFSQDIVATPRNFPGQNDYVQHFHNNIQRICLGLDPEYSLRLTSRCNLGPTEVMGIGPENEFLEYITKLYATPDRGWEIINLPAPAAKLITPDEYNAYHQNIAKEFNGTRHIPLIVDTHRTLTHNAAPYFIVCRNKECVADPSRTSTQHFEWIANEIGEPERAYKINGIDHTLTGNIEEPSVKYSFPTAAGYTETLKFKRIGGHKPNEINICKARIQNYINNTIRPGAAAPNTFSQLDGGNFCANYNNIIYKKDLSLLEQQKIAFSYVAKRAGDQLQVLSCKSPIAYSIPGFPGFGAGNYTISNCVFWTIDAIAACFAILNDITTVIQHPDKSVTIYKKGVYIPTFTPIVEGGGKFKKKQRAGACTREQLQAEYSSGSISDNCWNLAMNELCDITNNLYEPWTLLNFLVYFMSTQSKYNTLYNKLLNTINNPYFKLSNDNCFCLTDTDANQINKLQDIDINTRIGIPKYTRILLINSNDDFPKGLAIYQVPGGINGPIIRFSNVTEDTYYPDFDIPINFIISQIPNYLQLFYEFIGSSDFIYTNGGGIDYQPKKYSLTKNIVKSLKDRSKNHIYNTAYSVKPSFNNFIKPTNQTFYDNWKILQKEFNFVKANQLFLDFIQLLSFCETKYFQHIDIADNFYVYDPKSTIYIGGHTQIEFVTFIHTMINKYNTLQNNDQELEDFLKMFIHFPFHLNNTNNNSINTDIYDYIGSWFNYQTNETNKTNKTNEVFGSSTFKDIINITINVSNKINNKISSDSEKAAKYLNNIYPHGYFTIRFNELISKKSSLNKRSQGGRFITRKRKSKKRKTIKKYKK